MTKAFIEEIRDYFTERITRSQAQTGGPNNTIPERELVEPDDLDLFFASACKSTRQLPCSYQNRVKRP